MEQAITYKPSKGIRRAKERYITLAILLPAIFIAFLFLSPTTRGDSLATKVGIGLFSLVVSGVIFYSASSTALQKLSELSISIFPDRLERENRKQKEIFLWKDMQRVEILEYPNGEIASLALTLANKEAISLFGFEDMVTAVKQIEGLIPDAASIRRKRMRINWDHPIVMICISILTLVMIAAVHELGERAYALFNVFFFFSFGFYNLVFRPISRAQGKEQRIVETVVGIILIVCSVIILVAELFLE